jgi:citronellol/citronellal dehydrogenase
LTLHRDEVHEAREYGGNDMAASINKDGLLAGKVAVVTGASRGIGEAIALRYAQEGAKVVVSARTVEEGDHPLPGSINGVVKRINDAGGEAMAVRADLAVAQDREDLIKAAADSFGPVDVLVNNAAITFFIPVIDFPERRYKLMHEVQVYAPFHLSQLVLPSMIERKTGWIVNVSSHAALHPAVDAGGRGGTVYGMGKAALERFTTGLASEVYEDNVAVNVISPGLVATPGVVYHKLINESNKDRATPVEHMAEACLRLSYSPANELSGRITYAADMMEEFKLEAAELLA